MSDTGPFYEFVFRGLLADQALDRAGRPPRFSVDSNLADIAEALSLELLDPSFLDDARRMAVVYAAIAAFEGSARRFIAKVMLDEHGSTWWENRVSTKIRNFAESRRIDEEKTRWHGKRGDRPLDYTELGMLVDIVQQNWTDFEPYVRRVDWATAIFAAVERSRNVIMHSGTLDIEDIERLGISMRDWLKQVGP